MQLVLPRPCHQRILELAHSVPMAGQLGKKTTAHIARRFYWPTMYCDIADYCMAVWHVRRPLDSSSAMFPW